jgi:hypothetical protein
MVVCLFEGEPLMPVLPDPTDDAAGGPIADPAVEMPPDPSVMGPEIFPQPDRPLHDGRGNLWNGLGTAELGISRLSKQMQDQNKPSSEVYKLDLACHR